MVNVWVSDPKAASSDDSHSSAAQGAYGNINIKQTFERFAAATFSPGDCDFSWIKTLGRQWNKNLFDCTVFLDNLWRPGNILLKS